LEQWSNLTRSFDTDGRLADYPIGSDTRIITYDAASRITAYSDNTAVGDQQFAYDLVDRLSTYSDNSSSQSYQYDANGNRTSLNQNGTAYLSAIAPSSNRLLNVQGPAAKTYNYDPAGNLTSDAAATFTWNAAGRLYQTTSGGQVYTYTDNGLGERILKNSTALSNGPYRFVYDHAGHLIGEYDKNNSLKQETVWLGDTPVAVVKSAPAPQQIQVYFIQSDHLNAPRIILNNAKIPVWRWDHADAFGTTLPNEDPDGDGNTFEYNLRLPGQYYDQETGLHYNYFRDYDPSTGRYIASDPIGLKGGLNTYGYVLNNPLRYVDPTGLASCTYSISGHQLVCTSNAAKDPSFVGPPEAQTLGPDNVFSGNGPYMNDPNATGVRNNGPIPPGIYNMFPNEKPGHEGWWALQEPGWNKSDSLLYKLGLKRGGANLHIGNLSLGCITAKPALQNQYYQLTNLLNKESGANKLQVTP